MMHPTPRGLAAIAVFLATMAASPVTAQPAPGPTDPAPPVLSTVPMPPAGAQPQPGSMSGLPLQVGDLPPGTVAVRVVRQPFTNVVGQQVELRIGAEGRPRTASTGADGRAQFTGLAVGEHVMAVAVVDGERLESQLFQLPPRGGVRVLLLAGQGTGAPAGPAGSTAIAAPVEPVPDAGSSKTAIALVLLFATTGLGVWWSARRGSRAGATTAVEPRTGEPVPATTNEHVPVVAPLPASAASGPGNGGRPVTVAATVRNDADAHGVVVRTNAISQVLPIAARTTGRGSAVSGGELLMLALATCYCNDLYREAERLGIAIDGVEVEATAEFAGVGLAASNIRYRARVSSTAPADVIATLLRETDAVAEIHNTVRTGVPVTLDPMA